MSFAPIVLFAYNRPIHLQKTLDALANNGGASKSKLYIFCDGPKLRESNQNLNKIKKVTTIANAEVRFLNVEVIIQNSNKGLANSIEEGVTKIVNIHGKIIVLEDDIVTSSNFIHYMNDALDLYENNKKVMHISAYMYPHKENLPDTFFYNVPLCWGWATWKHAWAYYNPNALELWYLLLEKGQLNGLDKFGYDYLSSQLAHNISGKLKTWFVKWHASVLLNNGFTLYPNSSLVNNIGFDNSGVHNGSLDCFQHKTFSTSINLSAIVLEENVIAEQIIKLFYKNLRTKTTHLKFTKRLKRKLKNIATHKLSTLGFKKKDAIVIDKSYLGHNTKMYPKAYVLHTIIGNYTYVSHNSSIKHTIIGKYCSIGPNFISGWGVHPTNGISTHPMFYSNRKQNGISLTTHNKVKEIKPITIGNDVFIGMNVIVLDGVSIGHGAIIGAGAVVSKNIPPFAIAYGNPIKILKYRFSDEVIKQLLAISWWDKDDIDNKVIAQYFFDVNGFLTYVKSLNNLKN